MKAITLIAFSFLSTIASAAMIQYDFTIDYVMTKRPDLGTFRSVSHSLLVDSSTGRAEQFSADVINGTWFDDGAAVNAPMQFDVSAQNAVSLQGIKLNDAYWVGKYGEAGYTLLDLVWATSDLTSLDTAPFTIALTYSKNRVEFFGNVTGMNKVVLAEEGPVSVPEPGGLALALTGAAALMRRKSRS